MGIIWNTSGISLCGHYLKYKWYHSVGIIWNATDIIMWSLFGIQVVFGIQLISLYGALFGIQLISLCGHYLEYR